MPRRSQQPKDIIDALSHQGAPAAAWRAVQTGAILARSGYRTVRGRARDGEWPAAAARALRQAFEELGPTYVKLAQLVASSPGFFPEVLADEFRSCLDEVGPEPPAVIRRVVEEELGEPADVVFTRFDEIPLASASIGQVHAATTAEGTDVVVKVQRPGIRVRLEGDLRILKRIARILERTTAGRMANPVAVVDDFAAGLSDELNFMVAARSMERFERNLRAFGHNPDVRTPEVVWRYSTPRVLTMERVRGYSLDDLEKLSEMGHDLAAALKRGVRAWMESVLVHGFFHGDVHAGNLMIDDAGAVVMLDFGIVGRLDEKARLALRDSLPALMLRNDFRAVAGAIYELEGSLDERVLEAAAAEMEQVVGPLLKQPLSQISYGEILVDLIRIGTKHGVGLPRQLVLVAKQLLYFERYAKVMAPGWSILEDPEVIAFIVQPATTS
jgi:predicted unusual protein kinase regulating ubiquinone biosynthesis (AarF/ABC1/UbiB family)